MTLIDDARPALAGRAELRADPLTGEPILLYPEGVLHLNPTAAAIVELCNGTRRLEDIVAELAKRYEADAADLRNDVVACLDGLRKRQLVEVASK